MVERQGRDGRKVLPSGASSQKSVQHVSIKIPLSIAPTTPSGTVEPEGPAAPTATSIVTPSLRRYRNVAWVAGLLLIGGIAYKGFSSPPPESLPPQSKQLEIHLTSVQKRLDALGGMNLSKEAGDELQKLHKEFTEARKFLKDFLHRP